MPASRTMAGVYCHLRESPHDRRPVFEAFSYCCLIKADHIKGGLLCSITVQAKSFSRIDKRVMSYFPRVISILSDDAVSELHHRKERLSKRQDAIAIAHEPTIWRVVYVKDDR